MAELQPSLCVAVVDNCDNSSNDFQLNYTNNECPCHRVLKEKFVIT